MGELTYTPTTGVVVTGAGSGIGLASARLLAEVGRPVALWDIDGDRARHGAETIAATYGVASVGIGLDVADSAGFPAALDASREVIGPLGGLVHAAGTSGATPLGTLDDATWGRIVDVHLRSFALLVQAAHTDLRAAPGSAIVAIGSLSSFVGFEANPAYSAAKSGMIGLVHSFALSLARDSIRVNAVCPGYIDTPMMQASALATAEGRARFTRAAPLGRLGVAEDIARAVRFLLSEEASFVTGTQLLVDGGVLAQCV